MRGRRRIESNHKNVTGWGQVLIRRGGIPLLAREDCGPDEGVECSMQLGVGCSAYSLFFCIRASFFLLASCCFSGLSWPRGLRERRD